MRAEILSLDSPHLVGARIEIDAPAEKIFSYLADPHAHSIFDGSATVKSVISGPERLFLGARFGMNMKIKIGYRITNEVVEFQESKLIAWRHLMKWIWRYELVDLGGGITQVSEYFDATDCNMGQLWWLKKTQSLTRNPKWMAKSLVKLKVLAEG
jgi:uncharacterized protein YndB with AHSA1/START domain